MISDYELELHFNRIAEKYPTEYNLYDFDTKDWPQDHIDLIQELINKWNARLPMMNCVFRNVNYEAFFTYPPENKDDGVCSIVSEPYEVTKELRRKEKFLFLSERNKRKSEHFDMMARFWEEQCLNS